MFTQYPYTASGSKDFSFAGLGATTGLRPDIDNLHRGYGWGRMIDFDDLLLSGSFRHGATRLTRPAKDRKKTQYPISWR